MRNNTWTLAFHLVWNPFRPPKYLNTNQIRNILKFYFWCFNLYKHILTFLARVLSVSRLSTKFLSLDDVSVYSVSHDCGSSFISKIQAINALTKMITESFLNSNSFHELQVIANITRFIQKIPCASFFFFWCMPSYNALSYPRNCCIPLPSLICCHQNFINCIILITLKVLFF